MSEDRKPLWPWIVALLIGLPVLYVASFGPAVWIAAISRTRSDVVERFVEGLYSPIFWQMENCPHCPNDLLMWYGSVGIPRGDATLFQTVSERREIVVYVIFREL